jgi:TolA-binding protein
MEAYYELGKNQPVLLDSTEKYARLIIDRGSVAANASNQAQLYLGKVAYQRGDNEQAVDNFLKTLNAAKDESGAEAQYLMAEIQYKNEQYKQSIETLYDLNKNFPIYEYWLGMSFLLIADNYIALEENFQAKATLGSLIEKSPLKVIVDQARVKLAALEAQEQQEQEEQRKEDSLKLEEENQIVPEGNTNLN